MNGLDVRFADHLRASGWLDGAPGVVIGVSGGLDSMTLLHLLRGAFPGLPLHAAHVDHRMRDGSDADAAWVADICARWDVSCQVHTAAAPVTSEDEGRRLRYRFFEEVRQGLGGGAVAMTAHTADDQAETVLFRAARGSGVRGLAGIRPRRDPSVVRPLLPFWRRELEAHATEHGVPFREDPTNRDVRWTRNRLRREILPALADAVPGAARALAALAETSHLHAIALDELLDARIEAVGAGSGSAAAETLSLDRNALCAQSDPVLALVMRRAAARLGGETGRAATVALVRFVRESPSGRSVHVGGGVVVERHLDELLIRRGGHASRPVDPPRPPPRALEIEAQGGGEAVFAPGDGRKAPVRVAWGPSATRGFPHIARIPCDHVPFPLVLRAWEPGDRVEMPYGRKKVKKLLLEGRIPAHRREHFPVLTDAAGTLLWLPGVIDPVTAAEVPPGSRVCCVEVSFEHES
ncbi:MAG: tRNA lysidine(34) synthetase TilS [Gemmatimonadota bacterium]|nr:tRNA lysidine(34) synthetase TilS [Gemmatimonadota bacterium]MDE2866418.1 tRNA lysidine(34) synthetase TilS [Gemmatimonadota bacterium]